MMTFNPNKVSGEDSGIFGLSSIENDATLVLLPVPWEVTTSYRKGTANGPKVIKDASRQIDLFDADLGEFYKAGITMKDPSQKIQELNKRLRPKAEKIIAAGGNADGNATLQNSLKEINKGSDTVNEWVYTSVKALRMKKKLVGIVGGEHSTPFGAMKAFLEEYPSLGVFQIDAHCDLRKAFEGFEHSHASIMYNALTKLPLKKLVQVGIRDFCEEEHRMIAKEKKRIHTTFDRDLANWKQAGKSWKKMVQSVIRPLPKHVYISFDIDGLDPALCPHTGTPVPGGLTFNEATSFLEAIVESGRIIVGFDLNEVAPGKEGDWDANVGGRMLFKLCGWMLRSHKKA